MKKLLSLVALVGIMASCNNKKDEKKEEVKTGDTTAVTTPPVDNTTPPANKGSTEMPKFADADVQAYAQSYADLADAYVKAADSKDMAKFSELSKMSSDLAAKSAAMSQKLMNNPEEAKKLSDFIMAKSAQITEATKKLTGQ